MKCNSIFYTAQAADAPELAVLVNSAYRGETSRLGWSTEADLLGGQRTDAEDLLRFIRRSQTQSLCAFLLMRRPESTDNLESKIDACVQLERRETQAYLGMLTVRPNLQAQGLGRALLRAAEDYVCREWQSTQITMTVIVQRVELIAWYARRGYVATAERVPFPYEDLHFGIPKRQDLEFVVLSKDLSPLHRSQLNSPLSLPVAAREG